MEGEIETTRAVVFNLFWAGARVYYRSPLPAHIKSNNEKADSPEY